MATMFISIASFLALLDLASASPVPTPNSPSPSPSLQVCSNDELLKNIKNVFENTQPGLRSLGDLPVYAATSCQQVADVRPGAKSGQYWIQGDSGPLRVYCQMNEGESMCGEGVWMRIAHVNMTDSSASCPPGLEKVASPKSLCRKPFSSAGCSSVKFSTHGVAFSKVCGKVIGIQYRAPDAFQPYYAHQSRTIDDLYVDGVSITYSSSPRQHIWTLAAGLDETSYSTYVKCPCSFSGNNVPYTGVIPEFIGDDYFCATGSATTYTSRHYLEDPLWDGNGCGRFSTCCEGDRKPWFVKNFTSPVSSDIEVRVCRNEDQSDEDILIKEINLFVQ